MRFWGVNVIEMNMSKFQVDICMIYIFKKCIFHLIMAYNAIHVYTIYNYHYTPIGTLLSHVNML